MIRICVVEDDGELNYSLCTFLGNKGYQVTGCQNAMEAYDMMEKVSFDLVVTDIMMPEVDGFELTESIRSVDVRIPILFLTARSDMPAKERGYRIGIDDYMVKPVNFKELLLHIQALLRRASIANAHKIEIGNLVMDEEEHAVWLCGEELNLTAREFDILYKMLSYPQKTFSRSSLMNEFWGLDSDASLRSVDMHIMRLRDKLAGCDKVEIMTVRGVGYKAVIR